MVRHSRPIDPGSDAGIGEQHRHQKSPPGRFDAKCAAGIHSLSLRRLPLLPPRCRAFERGRHSAGHAQGSSTACAGQSKPRGARSDASSRIPLHGHGAAPRQQAFGSRRADVRRRQRCERGRRDCSHTATARNTRYFLYYRSLLPRVPARVPTDEARRHGDRQP